MPISSMDSIEVGNTPTPRAVLPPIPILIPAITPFALRPPTMMESGMSRGLRSTSGFCRLGGVQRGFAAYQLRVRQLHREFALTLEARVGERTRIARELHDTLLQSFHGVLLRLQILSQVLRERPMEAQQALDNTIDQAAEAITEGRDAVQGLRES